MSARRRGFALLAALWLLVAISGVALTMSLAARERRVAAADALELGRAQAAARSGLEDARARLERLAGARDGSVEDAGVAGAIPTLDPWRDAPRLFGDTVAFGEGGYRVTVRDASALLDLDRASEDELRRFFVALRIDASRADHLAEAIADWRDGDDLRRVNGAERDDYLRLGLPVLPRNAPFEDVSELRDVVGVTDDIYRLASPYLTVHGPAQVDLNAAPEPVLRALPGMTSSVIDALLRAHAAGRAFANLDDLARQLPAAARTAFVDAIPMLTPRVAFETGELEVTSIGWGDPARAHARLLARVARGGTTAYVTWRRMTP